MLAFLDESGLFANPNNHQNAPSCVAVLGIPHRKYHSICGAFDNWKKSEFGDITERKAKDLDERQVDAVLKILNAHRTTLEVVIFDPAIIGPNSVSTHKKLFSLSLTGGLDHRHSEDMHKYMDKLRIRIEMLNDQLYAQFQATILVIDHFIQTCLIEYWDSHPKELGSFAWLIDAKDPKRTTEMEDLWRSIILPCMQNRIKPLGTPEWNKEGHPFNIAFGGTLPAAPEWLFEGKQRPPGPFHFVKHGLILEDLKFIDSTKSHGVQLADIAATSLRRALSGTIQLQGVRRLGRLIVFRNPGAFHLMLLEDIPAHAVMQRVKSYGPVIEYLFSHGRTCAVHRHIPKSARKTKQPKEDLVKKYGTRYD